MPSPSHPDQIKNKQRRLHELKTHVLLHKGEIRRVHRELYKMQPNGIKAWLFRFKDRWWWGP